MIVSKNMQMTMCNLYTRNKTILRYPRKQYIILFYPTQYLNYLVMRRIVATVMRWILKFEPQLVVGILFLVIGGMDINKKPSQRTADILNNVIVVLIFLITLVNVIINGIVDILFLPYYLL